VNGVPRDEPGSSDEDVGCAAALAALGASPRRLRRLLAGCSPRAAWEAVLAGDHPADPEGRSRRAARPGLPEELARRCRLAGIEVVVLGSSRYPARLAADREAPAVLFARGDPTAGAGRPAVAVVGTRSATGAGRDRALEIGATLAAAGVVVVSGLAPGIDLCALAGTLTAGTMPAVAVLGAAHDSLVRSEQRRIAEALGKRGAVLSELPPGAPGARWRFAVRNRVLAALADVVVVVECHERGGAMHTVRYAARRAVPVAVVPGSTASPASDGTNAMLVGGAACVRGGADVVELLRAATGWRPAAATEAGEPPSNGALEPPLDECAERTLAVLGADPVTLDAVVLRTGFALGAAAVALEELDRRGLVRGEGGFWWRSAALQPGRRRTTTAEGREEAKCATSSTA
jgi:DNA processing protein